MLKSKIHRATVTEANLHYSGSITIDDELLKAANILNHEKVAIVNVTNGARLETYAIAGTKGQITINGAAAHLCHKGDTVIIISYANLADEEAKQHHPLIVHVDQNNNLVDSVEYTQSEDDC